MTTTTFRRSTAGCLASLVLSSCSPKPASVEAATPKNEARPAIAPAAAPATPLAPSPDHSLSPEAYVVAGLPAIDRLWSRYDYSHAAPAIEALAQRDPALLPRLHSAKSGEVFARMVDVRNFDSESGFGIDAGLPILEASSSMLRVYIAAHRGAPSFAHEMAALQVFTLALSARFLPAVLRMEPPKNEPARSKVEKGKAQIVSGLTSIVGGMLLSMKERATYDHEDRTAMARALEGDALTVVRSLPALTQLELCSKYEEVGLSEPLEDVKTVLLRAQRACPAR